MGATASTSTTVMTTRGLAVLSSRCPQGGKVLEGYPVGAGFTPASSSVLRPDVACYGPCSLLPGPPSLLSPYLSRSHVGGTSWVWPQRPLGSFFVAVDCLPECCFLCSYCPYLALGFLFRVDFMLGIYCVQWVRVPSGRSPYRVVRQPQDLSWAADVVT